MTGTCLKHAIADREGIVEFGTGRFTHLRKGDPIGQMPWSELIGVTWACREPQLELALDLARQIQDHNAVRGRRPYLATRLRNSRGVRPSRPRPLGMGT